MSKNNTERTPEGPFTPSPHELRLRIEKGNKEAVAAALVPFIQNLNEGRRKLDKDLIYLNLSWIESVCREKGISDQFEFAMRYASPELQEILDRGNENPKPIQDFR